MYQVSNVTAVNVNLLASTLYSTPFPPPFVIGLFPIVGRRQRLVVVKGERCRFRPFFSLFPVSPYSLASTLFQYTRTGILYQYILPVYFTSILYRYFILPEYVPEYVTSVFYQYIRYLPSCHAILRANPMQWLSYKRLLHDKQWHTLYRNHNSCSGIGIPFLQLHDLSYFILPLQSTDTTQKK